MEVQKKLFLIANAVRNELIEQLERNGSVFKGHLKNSIKVYFENGNLVITGLSYGLDLEYGRIPRDLNMDDLKEWCRIKLGDESLATPIAQKILREGINPAPFLRPVLFNKLQGIINKYA